MKIIIHYRPGLFKNKLDLMVILGGHILGLENYVSKFARAPRVVNASDNNGFKVRGLDRRLALKTYTPSAVGYQMRLVFAELRIRYEDKKIFQEDRLRLLKALRYTSTSRTECLLVVELSGTLSNSERGWLGSKDLDFDRSRGTRKILIKKKIAAQIGQPITLYRRNIFGVLKLQQYDFKTKRGTK